MSTLRIALANIPFPATPVKSVTLAEQATARASTERADLICFPECFVPGYRGMGKVQLDPSEEGIYSAGSGRRVFQAGPLTFGIAICHEGWRYPETVRWAARRGAHIVFHPHFHQAEPGGYQPSSFADPANSFHEKAALCRAAENTCFFATVNYASPGSPTTSALVRPDGTLLSYQPYGKPGLLVADIDLAEATGLLAARCKSEYPSEALGG
jgi:predicted amidohydrolase